mmetsp:Transcript_9178/g.26465  ORF Transcript_9178/g.26465 Transcript_9178/m.26465 type:complete len:210 (+) Transcript_9178:64-693(+)
MSMSLRASLLMYVSRFTPLYLCVVCVCVCRYLCFPMANEALRSGLFKVQDTLVICPPGLSQRVALGCLEAGSAWVADDTRLGSVRRNRAAVKTALTSLLGESNVKGGDGAIYFFCRLPQHIPASQLTDTDGEGGEGGEGGQWASDECVVRWLVREYGVVVIPGSACGSPGHIRVAFANLGEDKCADAAERLGKGLGKLVELQRGAVHEM